MDVTRTAFGKRVTFYLNQGRTLRIIKNNPRGELVRTYGYFVPEDQMMYDCENCYEKTNSVHRFKFQNKWHKIYLCEQCKEKLL